MDTAFAQPHCPAIYSTSSTSPTMIPPDSTLPQVRNDALVYLAIAVAGFAAVPTLFWLRDKRHKDRERRRNRAVVECLKAKMDATRALGSATAMALDVSKLSTCAAAPTSVDPTPVDEMPDVDGAKEKKKRSKDRRKRGRDREPSRYVKSKKRLPSPQPSTVQESRHDPPMTDYTPRAPEQPHLSNIPDKPRAPSPVSPSMLNIASPTPVSLISASFRAQSPSLQTRSETWSQPGQSRSASASPTTAPLTPPLLPASVSLPPLVAVRSQELPTWVPQLSHIPHDDPAWDWDGQSSTYSTGSPSRAPSSSGSHSHLPSSKQPRTINMGNAPPLTVSSPASTAASAMPSTPSLVFPSLNAHPPPGASLTMQIAGLKGALEASRTREDNHRRDAERWSKECDLIKWRWNEAADMWRRREAELQAQMHHLVLQLQTVTHTMQAASLSPPVSFIPAPGQTSFPLTMPFPSHHGSSFVMTPANGSLDMVNEDLAEAILKRPGAIKSAISRSRGAVRRAGEEHASLVEDVHLQQQTKPEKQHDHEEIIEFEFPTLLERPVHSPRLDTEQQCGNSVSADEVAIFN